MLYKYFIRTRIPISSVYHKRYRRLGCQRHSSRNWNFSQLAGYLNVLEVAQSSQQDPFLSHNGALDSRLGRRRVCPSTFHPRVDKTAERNGRLYVEDCLHRRHDAVS